MDVTIRHPCALKYHVAAARADGAAALEAERNKRVRYPALAVQGLAAVTPFAMESFGRLGQAALVLLGEARHRVEERSGRHAAGVVTSRWHGWLQCQLVRAQHEALIAMMGAHSSPLELACVPFARVRAAGL